MRKQITLIILFTTLTIFVFAQNTVQDYVNRFGAVAVTEMQRTGIPASVILAQGILISSFGNSQLALQANNHFNLHCDDAWDGELFYKWERGEKVKRPSCFRVYSKPEESFLEFTNVVANHNQIAPLVSYDDDNYKHWVRKLIEIGFTRKSEDQMVRVIEQFMLVEFDEVQDSKIVHKNTQREVYSINGLKAVVAKNDDTPLSIATELGVPYNKILKYNDLQEGSMFIDNQYVFVEAKRKRSKINEEFHVLRTGETLYDVAQVYGIKLKSLSKLNHVSYSDKIASGERIYLVESAPVRPRFQGERPPTKPKYAIIAAHSKAKTIPAKPKEVIIEAPSGPILTTVGKVKEERLPPTKPIKEKNEQEEEVLSYVNTAEFDMNYVIPTPGHTNPDNASSNEVATENQAAQPIMQSLSEFDTRNKQQETISDVLKQNENKPEILPHSNAFGNQEKPVINQAPLESNFKELMNLISLRNKNELEDSAPVPEFEMDNKEEEIVPKVKRDGYHIVEKGETLYRISVNYGVTVGQIRKWNKLTDNTILRGQELKISL